MSRRPPHIILICADQWRSDTLGHHGNPAARTPVLDALAATEAVSFRHAHCQHPVCTPSRCSFMTGWYPHTLGHRDQQHMVRDPDALLLHTLRQGGWKVCWAGKNDLVPAEHGFAAIADEKPVCTPAPYPLYEQTRERRGAHGSDTFYERFCQTVAQTTPAMEVHCQSLLETRRRSGLLGCRQFNHVELGSLVLSGHAKRVVFRSSCPVRHVRFLSPRPFDAPIG